MKPIEDKDDLRGAFWDEHPELAMKFYHECYCSYSQNQFPVEARLAWCDFVEAAVRDGRISEEFARTVTL